MTVKRLWTEREDLILVENYSKLTPSECVELLEGRNLSSVKARANRLGLKSQKYWTEEEVALLKINYPLLGAERCANLLNKSSSSIKNKACKLGLHSNFKWNDEDTKFLVKNYSIYGATYCSNHLNRSKEAVRLKAQDLGIKYGGKWQHLSDEDLLQLVRVHKLSYIFMWKEELPDYKVILRRFNVDSWHDVLKLAGLSSNGPRPLDPATFYILRFIDTNNAEFYKYGYTQNSVKVRYQGRKDLDIVHSHTCSLEEARVLEKELRSMVKKYLPIDARFYTGHAGHTECFVAVEEIG